ncbi:hypothetical protein TNCV_2075621 [Trichonephila clavipes]|nr:hypothetical protein TNCV_2075621 [Trichonephila clavipes]
MELQRRDKGSSYSRDETPEREVSKEVSKFLGIFQWYSKFIKNYADLCEPLYNLKKKFKKFFWSVEAQKAFDAVKSAITEAPVLKLPDFKKSFDLFTDTSSMGIGINQEQRYMPPTCLIVRREVTQ